MLRKLLPDKLPFHRILACQADGGTHYALGRRTRANLRFEDMAPAEWTFEREQRRVQAPTVYAFTVEGVFAALQKAQHTQKENKYIYNLWRYLLPTELKL